jgi:hypothetical protein
MKDLPFAGDVAKKVAKAKIARPVKPPAKARKRAAKKISSRKA